MSRVVVLVLALILSIALLTGCMSYLEPDVSGVEDGVEYIRLKYNIPPERVLALAALLGVSRDEIPNPHEFDPALPFPIAYFIERFEAFAVEHGRNPTRPEVDQIVKGYVVRCQVISAYTDYLFYETNVNRNKQWRRLEAAVIMRVNYDENPTMRYKPELAVYEDVDHLDIPVDPYDLLGYWGYSSCIHNARRDGLLGTPTPEP